MKYKYLKRCITFLLFILCIIAYSDKEIAKATGDSKTCVHDYQPDMSSQVPGTCIQKGTIVSVCTKCGDRVTHETTLGGHDSVIEQIPATCTSGPYVYISCKRCHLTQTIPLEGSPLGHNYVSSESSIHTPGKGHFYESGCTRCSYSSGYNNYDVSYTSPTHTVNGHYYKNYCSKCGLVYSEGYTAVSTCLSCTTPPSVSFNNMNGDTVLSDLNISFCPEIKVFDNENDTLTCNYYLDGSATASGTMIVAGTNPEKTAAFPTPINILSLSDGVHTIRATVKDSIAPMGEVSLTFRVDKTAPAINSVNTETTTSSAKLTVGATDAISGLAVNAYRYTINGIVTDWISSNSYSLNNLTSDTSYSYKIEVKDNCGHITEINGNIATKVEKPVINAVALAENQLLVIIKDNNPALTRYRIKVGNGYVDPNYAVTGIENWIPLDNSPMVGGKILNLANLSPNMEYTITVTARNTATGELEVSNSITVTTSPSAPSNLLVNVKSKTSIQVSWDAAPGAISYELYRETLSDSGEVLASKTYSSILTNKCIDTDIVKNQTYRYKLHAMNQSGIYGNWTDFVVGSTLPSVPVKVTGVNAEADNSKLNLTWGAIPDAVGYEVEVIYDGNTWCQRFAANQATVDTGILNCQCSVRIRAFNVFDDDMTNSTLWRNPGEWSESKIFYTEVNAPIVNDIDSTRITPHSVELTWSANGNPESTQYKVGVFKDNVLVSESSYTTELVNLITDMASETAYTFKVKARNNAQVETDWSNEVSATTLIDYPSVPSGLKSISKTDRIILSWTPSERAQSYQIERNGEVIATDYTDTTFTDIKLKDDTKYSYRVNAINTTGESGWSYVLDTKTLSNLPDAPAITSASGSSVYLVISWAPSDRANTYEIEADGDSYDIGTDLSYEHNGLLPGSYHTYRVRGRNGYGAGDWSGPYTVMTTPAVPDIPNNINIATTDKQISVLWDAVENADTYDIEINGEVFSQITATEFLYSANGEAVPGAQYTVRVRAVNEGGNSEWSFANPAILKNTGEGEIPVIAIPSIPAPVCSVSGASIVMIKWDKCQDATIYQVEADDNIIYTGACTDFAHTGLGEKTAHQYRVRAGNSSGFSEWSNIVRVITDAADPYAPQNLNYYRNDTDKTTILWDKVSNISNYCVEVNGILLEGVINDTKVDINTKPGEMYTARIGSIRNIDLKQKINWSETITFRAPRNLPAAPTMGKATATSDSILAEWTPIVDAYGYEVEFDGQVYDNGANLSYMKTNLNVSTSYNIRVRAYNESGTSSWSEIKTVMTDEGIPGVPINITGESIASIDTVSGSAIKITWDPLEGVSSYDIEDANGTLTTTNINMVVMNDLVPGQKYDFRVRAVSDAGAGAWSSKISFTPVITAPTNVVIQAADGKVRLSWNKVAGIKQYEVEIDRIIYTTTELTSIDFENSIFNTQRKLRVRACFGDQRSEWSQEVNFDQTIPITFETYTGEIISAILPVKNAEISKYTLTLQYSTDELEVLDACELTPALETSSIYIEELNTYIIIGKNGSKGFITFIVDGNENMDWSGIVSSIRFQSKITGSITVSYNAKLK